MTRRAVALVVIILFIVAAFPMLRGGGSDSRASGVVAGRVHETFQPNDGKIYILVLGSDARHGNPQRARSDAIHIVGINAETMRGGILNFPRDSWVDIPGYGSAKINEAMERGGPQLLARTLEKLTGIRLDYWVLTGFEGFEGLIRRIGNVPITLKRDIYDPGGSGARLKAGRRRLPSWRALAYVRTRKVFKDGDIARTSNQARFLLQMLKLLNKQVERDPSAVFKWIAAGREFTDLNISADELFRLSVLATQVDVSRIGNVTVPVSIGSIGASSVVFISPRATALYSRFREKASLR